MNLLTDKEIEEIDFNSTLVMVRFDSSDKEVLERTLPSLKDSLDELVCGGYCYSDVIEKYNDMISIYTMFNVKVVSKTPSKIRLSVDLDEHDL